jgi:hypothetical protein
MANTKDSPGRVSDGQNIDFRFGKFTSGHGGMGRASRGKYSWQYDYYHIGTVDDVAQCLVSAHAAKSDSDTGVTANALADALSNITVGYDGDVTLDLTRHGKHGAVHQVDLTGSMGNGTLFVQSAASSAQTDATADASASAEVDAAASLIAQAVATLFQGIDFDIDLGVTDITVKAGSEAKTEVNMDSDAYAESSAFATASAAAGSDTDASASATGVGNSASGSSFYVQGANIEEFNAQLNLASGMFVDVQTDVLAQAYADAIATSLAHALAKASVKAEAKASLSFEYDLPVIGSGSLPIVTDFDSATVAAQQIMNAVEVIAAQAKAMAESSASTFASSAVNLILSVQYENLPGTEDLLVSSAVGNLVLNCNQDLVNANADAQAESH